MLANPSGDKWLMASLMYGAGSRILLPAALDRKYPNVPRDWRWQMIYHDGDSITLGDGPTTN